MFPWGILRLQKGLREPYEEWAYSTVCQWTTGNSIQTGKGNGFCFFDLLLWKEKKKK